jgi:hypothetical protein
MSKIHSNLQLAVTSAVKRQDEQQPPQDATAAAILSFRRELKSADVDELGMTVYFYDPPSVAEKEAHQKHMRYDGNGLSVSLLGIVDGIIARVRNKAGKTLFTEGDRARLLELPADRIMSIWNAIGGEAGRLSQALVDAAEKK